MQDDPLREAMAGDVPMSYRASGWMMFGGGSAAVAAFLLGVVMGWGDLLGFLACLPGGLVAFIGFACFKHRQDNERDYYAWKRDEAAK